MTAEPLSDFDKFTLARVRRSNSNLTDSYQCYWWGASEISLNGLVKAGLMVCKQLGTANYYSFTEAGLAYGKTSED